ncbi:MAG: hypothetical protein Q7J10_08065 [Methanosarcinaceae archaeon]|nr:hypothetical protein [Methanosarcinaceae archaeon]
MSDDRRGGGGGFRGGSSGGRGGSSGGSGGFRPSGPRDMHKAKCADCGEETEVPFKPDPERPVYCRECYPKHKPKRY